MKSALVLLAFLPAILSMAVPMMEVAVPMDEFDEHAHSEMVKTIRMQSLGRPDALVGEF